MKAILTSLLIAMSTLCFSEPLENLVTLEDGLDSSSIDNIADDYVRLRLHRPSYQTAHLIKKSIEDWLGPNLVIVTNASSLKIQAPRDSSKRVEFLAALLNLDINQ